MSFNPDSRNVGGRKEIMDILNNHHLTLLNMKSTMKTRASYLKFKKPLHSMSNVHKKKKSFNFLYFFCLFIAEIQIMMMILNKSEQPLLLLTKLKEVFYLLIFKYQYYFYTATDCSLPKTFCLSKKLI